MKKEVFVRSTLEDEVDPYKVKDLSKIKGQISNESKGFTITAGKSGYIQLVDFITIIEEAQKTRL